MTTPVVRTVSIMPVVLLCVLATTALATTALAADFDYERARWHPVHFSPMIEQATDEQCLACHQEILARRPLARSPAGVKATDSMAWYQTLDTYEGEQDTFHRRHLASPLATRLMNLKCNACHQGNNPREEAPIPPAADEPAFTSRKMVNPSTTCLKCHGQFSYQNMALPGPWSEIREQMSNNCLLCHGAIRTDRHNVTYLNAEAIEEEGAKSSDVCYGCHGGRAWYRNGYPYPRHSYPGMAEEVPEWAKDRPTQSEARFRPQ